MTLREKILSKNKICNCKTCKYFEILKEAVPYCNSSNKLVLPMHIEVPRICERFERRDIEAIEEFRQENCEHRCILNSENMELKTELEQKDKIIDLMAIKLTSFEGLEPNEFEGAKEYIKKYFETKAKEDK